MFTREDLFLYFGDRFSKEKILQALHELAKVDAAIDPEAVEFHGSIVERMEQIFKVIDQAIASNKQMTGVSSIAQIEQTAIDLNINHPDIPIEVFKGFVDIVAGEAIARAVLEHQLHQTVYNQTLTDLDAKALQGKNQQAANRIALMTHLISNPETVEKILQDYDISTNSTSGLIETTNSCSIDFDPDAFLAEVGGSKKPLTVPTTLRTVQDTKLLTQSLLKQYRAS